MVLRFRLWGPFFGSNCCWPISPLPLIFPARQCSGFRSCPGPGFATRQVVPDPAAHRLLLGRFARRVEERWWTDPLPWFSTTVANSGRSSTEIASAFATPGTARCQTAERRACSSTPRGSSSGAKARGAWSEGWRRWWQSLSPWFSPPSRSQVEIGLRLGLRHPGPPGARPESDEPAAAHRAAPAA